mgnify:CR=1 FL=1
MVPRLLLSFVDEPLNNLPKIYKTAKQMFPNILKIYLVVEE